MRKYLSAAFVLIIIAALAFGPAAMTSRAADHLDAPLVKTDGRLDINDVYAFQSPVNPANTVLIMTVNPLAGVLSPLTFHPSASYEFKIDTNGDAREDMTYKITFSEPKNNGAQTVKLRFSPSSRCGHGGEGSMAKGLTGTNIPVRGGGTLRAGIFDDPFFFDLAAFKNGLAFCPGGVGTNFFAGLNVTAIVLEVPSTSFRNNNIGVWARTMLDDDEHDEMQVDRMGRPAINTVFIPADKKDAFNFGKPRNDQRDFRANVVGTLVALGNSNATANALADVLLPDILTFNTASSAGFLNGRALSDDVIDAELSLISGGAIPGDCVANDSVFTTTFPYLAPPN